MLFPVLVGERLRVRTQSAISRPSRKLELVGEKVTLELRNRTLFDFSSNAVLSCFLIIYCFVV